MEELGGIRISKRGIPGWLIMIAVVMLSISVWYLLSFSSTTYTGSFPRPAPPAVAPAE